MRRALLCLTLLAAACGPQGRTQVRVFAASSLTEPFQELARMYEAGHPGGNVVLNFGGSSALVRQIRQGAGADVLATADEVTMAQVTTRTRIFARNHLAIAVFRGNPKKIAGLADLGRPGLTVVLCASQVPCGRSSDEVLARAGVTVRAASREENVKAVLSKVALGEADAGLVYASDIDGSVAGVAIPASQNVTSLYPVAVLRPAGKKFVALVTSRKGRSVLRRYGFDA